MRILTQNVESCEVYIENKLYSSINKGFCLFVSFSNTDTKEIVDKMIKKLLSARFFPDHQGKTNLNYLDYNAEMMSISQFTLYGSIKEGNRPSFTDSMPFDKAKEFYEYFNRCLEKNNIKFKTGIFGADMKVHIINDGPFTMMLDSDSIIKV